MLCVRMCSFGYKKLTSVLRHTVIIIAMATQACTSSMTNTTRLRIVCLCVCIQPHWSGSSSDTRTTRQLSEPPKSPSRSVLYQMYTVDGYLDSFIMMMPYLMVLVIVKLNCKQKIKSVCVCVCVCGAIQLSIGKGCLYNRIVSCLCCQFFFPNNWHL